MKKKIYKSTAMGLTMTDKLDPRDTKRFSQNQLDDILADVKTEAALVKATFTTVLWHIVKSQGGEIRIDRTKIKKDHVPLIDMSVENDEIVVTIKKE